MTDDKKQQNLRINEDFSKSYTHERPAPDTNPPTSRATSTGGGNESQASSTDSSQSESPKKINANK